MLNRSKLAQRMMALVLALFVMTSVCPAAWAAAAQPTVRDMRSSQSAQTVRLVFDMEDGLPQYTIHKQDNPAALVIEFAGQLAGTLPPVIAINDPVVQNITLQTVGSNKVRVLVYLKQAITYNSFLLRNPDRLVVDIIKEYDHKVTEQVVDGMAITTVMRSRQQGPVTAYILDIAPRSSVAVKPILANDSILGLETVKSMADRHKVLAAVNASYFALSGHLLGVTKLDGVIVSTLDIARTALGIMPDGSFIIGQVEYSGTAILPDGSNLPINGINQVRGSNSLMIYNRYYGATTKSNQYGAEYVVQNDQVTAIYNNDAPIPSDGYVISVHGEAAKRLEHVQVGDPIRVFSSLGAEWDGAEHIVGAGPALLKDGAVFLTTKNERFGNDVAGGRAPRTAAGITDEGHLLLAVVDGRQHASGGFSLQELALFMKELGAVDAVNLDGGGSSEMVVDGKIINNPSDRRERRIGSALAVFGANGE